MRKDGTPIHVEVRTIPIRHRGKPHVLAIARDVSGRRAAEAERAQLEKQLRQAQKKEANGHHTSRPSAPSRSTTRSSHGRSSARRSRRSARAS